MSKRTTGLLIAIALVAILAVACGGGSSGSGAAAANLTLVTKGGFVFEPKTLSATPGQTINLTVKNEDAIEHTFVLPAANVKLTIPAGQSGTKIFTAPAAGTYDFDCDVAGHKEAGMKGTLVVK